LGFEFELDKIHKWGSAGGTVFQFSAAAAHELAGEFTRKSPTTGKSFKAKTAMFASRFLLHLYPNFKAY
jgi:hypothetical protein